MTRQKDLEAENRRLREWAESLEALTEERAARLDGKQKELEAFLYSVSHDLKAPILSIVGFSSLLTQEFGSSLPEAAKRYLARIDSNAHTMRALIDDLLELSRLGSVLPSREPIDMAALAKEAKDGLAYEISAWKAVVEIAELPRATGDRRRLLQVFSNLLGNALRYREPSRHPVILVYAVPQQNAHPAMRYVVEDNGVGVPAHLATKIFLPFQRGVPGEDGTGIGLAIVQRIVEGHGGRVGVDPGPEVGSRFWFELPAKA